MWRHHIEWLPFYARSWKCFLPTALVVFGFFRLKANKSKQAIAILAGILSLSAFLAYDDISNQRCDLSTFGPKDGRVLYYFTWWWCKQRPW